MTADQCVFCEGASIAPLESGGHAFDCEKLWDYAKAQGGQLDEEVLMHYLSAWCGTVDCSFYKPTGNSLYSRFFRYIYIALELGRDTQ